MFNSPSFLLPPLEMGSGGDTMGHPYHENYQIEIEESEVCSELGQTSNSFLQKYLTALSR